MVKRWSGFLILGCGCSTCCTSIWTYPLARRHRGLGRLPCSPGPGWWVPHGARRWPLYGAALPCCCFFLVAGAAQPR